MSIPRLTEIASLIALGAPPERFKDELDLLLGTELRPRDTEAEAVWEASYRESNG